MKDQKRFTPTEPSPTHVQENQSFLLLQILTKSNENVVWKLEGGVVQDRDGIVELYKDKLFAGRLEVQVRPVDSQRKNKPCYQLDACLVGHSFRAGLPFILICYDRDQEIAYWKLISEELFLNTPADQQSVTVNFDPVRDRIGEGFPYFERWLELNSLHLEAVNEYRDLWQKLSTDISLKDLPDDVIDGYQRYIDTLNVGFDTEFSAVKRILFPNVWKFGVCIYEAKSPSSSHRLYRIPKGKNGLLVMKGTKQEVSDWFDGLRKAQAAPLGFHSKIFTVRALHDSVATNFLDRPERHAEEFLYKSFYDITDNEDFPLYGEMLCRENIFEFADFFALPLELNPVPDQMDVADLLNRIEKMVDWLVDVILTSSVSGLVQLDNSSIRQFAIMGLTDGFQMKPRQADERLRAQLRQAVRTTNYFQLALSSCQSLINLNMLTVDRVFTPAAHIPLALSKTPDMALLKKNFQIIFQNSIAQYKEFVSGNRFRNLNSPVYLDDDTALYYLVDIDSWPATYSESNGIALFDQIHCCRYVIPNSNRELPKVTIEFANPLPKPELNVTVNGKQYNATQAMSCALMKIYSAHPLREQMYEMLKTDSKRSYDPSAKASHQID